MLPPRSFPANCTPGPRLIPSYIYFNVSVVFIIFRFRSISGPVVLSSTLFSAAPFPLTMSTSPHFSGLFALTQIEYCRKQLKPISCKNRYTDQEWFNHGEALIEIYCPNTPTPNLPNNSSKKNHGQISYCSFVIFRKIKGGVFPIPDYLNKSVVRIVLNIDGNDNQHEKNTIFIQKPSSSCGTRCPCSATCCRRTR